jgi:hypothetical protein
VPVKITPPGNVASVRADVFLSSRPANNVKIGDDTNTLRKIEARIQADFKNGLPPHLQPNASSMECFPGSGQSGVYVTSHSEFSKLHPRDIQRILRQRLILVHGNPIDFDYGWDLDSFGRIYDVDKKTTVHGGFLPCQLNILA